MRRFLLVLLGLHFVASGLLSAQDLGVVYRKEHYEMIIFGGDGFLCSGKYSKAGGVITAFVNVGF